MRYSLVFSALAGLAIAAPQNIDIDGINAAPDPVFVAAPYDVVAETPAPAPTSSVEPITTGVARRSTRIQKRDGNCAKQPPGSGPVPSPDTVDAFTSDTDFQVNILIPSPGNTIDRAVGFSYQRSYARRLCPGLFQQRWFPQRLKLHGTYNTEKL